MPELRVDPLTNSNRIKLLHKRVEKIEKDFETLNAILIAQEELNQNISIFVQLNMRGMKAIKECLGISGE